MYKFIWLCILLVSCSSLSKSISERDYKQIELFLEQGYDVNKGDFFGYPLLKAVTIQDMALIIKLLDNGADINIKNGSGQTALYIAVSKGNKSIVRYLLERKADPHILTVYKMSPFVKAVESVYKNDFEIIDIFLENGYDINNTDASFTALTMAVREREPLIVKYLLGKGADPNLKSRNGIIPLKDATRTYIAFKNNINIYRSTPESRKDVADRMAVIISLLKQYGAKDIE